ncbi:MAG: winged helix-turn-helix domain-containing protein [Gammaproteobacteria bacterium]
MIYRFENLLLDADRRELRAGDRLLKLQPRIFDLILYLIRHRDRVVAKDELLDKLWPGVVVVEGALQRAISLARSCLREACGAECIRTHARKGYRFVAEVVETGSAGEGADQATAASATDLARPPIAVLPLDNLSNDPEQDYVAEGLAEDISTGLSRLRYLAVISRASILKIRDRLADLEAAASELGARYLLTGSVRKSADRLRVYVELIETAGLTQIWSQSFDSKIDDIFRIQDEITTAIVATIEPEFNQFEYRQARNKSPDNLDAWEAYQRGLWHLYQFTRADTVASLPFFERASALDPEFAPAFAGASFYYFSSAYLGFATDWNETAALARSTADSGVSADPRCPAARWALGRALLLDGQLDAAIDEFATSVDLNPNFAHAYYMLGWALTLAGEPAAAIEYLDTAERLSPHDPLLFAFRSVRAMALIGIGDNELALKFSDQAVRQPNSHQHTLAVHIAALIACGELQKAGDAANSLLDIYPGYSCSSFARAMPFRSERDLGVITGALEAAGIPPLGG